MAISKKRRLAILAAHDGVCHYCAAPGATHVDHIIPRADGGTDDLGNLIAACLLCNLRKQRRRLPPDAEARTLAAAEAMRPAVMEILDPPKANDSVASDTGKRTVRLCLLLTRSEAMDLDRWRRARNMDTRAAAIRHAMHISLEA
jgi:hypothetical protein